MKVAKNQDISVNPAPTLTVPTHLAASVPDNSRIPWNRDGKNGPQDPNHSEAILIDWITTPGNYDRYRGTGNNGLKKIQFAAMIAAKIKDAGVRKSRTPKDVQNKIEYVEKCFRCAHDWSHTETGAGLRENDSGTYEEALLRKCPWYFDIREIFEDRANARPFHTTDDMFQEASSDDDSECHRRSNIVHLENDEDTEDEEDIKVGPVARSLFGANDGKDGKGKKLRYSPLEPSLFAPVAGNVEDVSNDNDDIRYDYDDDVEVVEDVGVEEDGGIKEDGVVREDRFVKVDGDIGRDSALEKENKGAKVLNKKAGKKELHTKSKTTIPLSVNKKKEIGSFNHKEEKEDRPRRCFFDGSNQVFQLDER